ncbi:hypothetical protein [Mucilaginibacter ginsenosidivorans]|uniref:Lipocalin-like domain-containing protein n=1 Tax=Mucilaginibacter ginsenosidivorans TaxID=398053 RepID=A0A5B8UVL6_9SPHI|nr:hypothetical protein [Mucilaginibacter ginsenosidivorans]QEC62972.1 hypothetical protein FRZ54_10405 [Mucilaginibacter ginsenosidivorans]
MRTLSIVFILAATACFSCKKEAVNVNKPGDPVTGASTTKNVSYPIEGKWQMTKLVVYLLDTNNVKHYDTTYYNPITKDDYVQFNNDGTCVTSIDHYYYLNEPGFTVPTPISPLLNSYFYKLSGKDFVLTPQINAQGPGGGTSSQVVSTPDANTLLIHGEARGIGPNLFVSDSYYVKDSF